MNKVDFEKMKKINLQMMGEQLASFWHRSFGFILMLFLFLMIAVGGYFWYFNLYRSDWSEAERNNFLNSQSKDAELRVDMLEKVIQRIESRKDKFNQETFSAKNIFKPF